MNVRNKSLQQSENMSKWENVRHLTGRNINVKRSDGSIESDWYLDQSRQYFQPLFDPNTNNPIGPGVWCKKTVYDGYLEKAVPLSLLLEHNP